MSIYQVKSSTVIRLKDWNPEDDQLFSGKKEDALDQIKALNKELDALQELLYAEHKHRLLIVLQGMDTAGKDGVIRKVFEGVNPQGVKVASFKTPTSEELSHDYLWRVHKQVPGKGEMVIFNRSIMKMCWL